MKKTNSFKRAIALFISVLMVVSSLPFTAITASAAESRGVQKHGLIVDGNNDERYNESNHDMNIVNDGQDVNTSVGIISFDIADLKGKRVNNAKLNAKGASYSDNSTDDLRVNFYYSFSSASESYIDANGKENLNGKNIAGSGAGQGETALDKYLPILGADKFNNYIGSIDQGDTNSNSFDITPALRAAINAKKDNFYIIIMLNQADGTGNGGGGWSDSHFYPNDQSISFEINNSFDAQSFLTESKGSLDSNSVKDKQPESFNFGGYRGNSYSSKAASNMVWCSQTLTQTNTHSKFYADGYSTAQVNNVMAYDGVNEPWAPVVSVVKAREKSRQLVYYHISLIDASNVEMRNTWEGYSSDGSIFNVTSGQTWTINISGDNDCLKNFNTNTFGSSWIYFWNELYPNTSYIRTNDYYVTGTLAGFQHRGRHASTTWPYAWSSTQEDNLKFSNNNNSPNPKYYTINYEPLRRIIDGSQSNTTSWGSTKNFKDLYNEVINAGDNTYTAESLADYYRAVNNILAINVKGAFNGINDSEVEGKVKSVSNDIKTAVMRYNAAVQGLKKHTYNSGVVTSQPTCTAAGVKTFTCTECGFSYNVAEGSALGHSFTTKASNTKVTDATCTASATYYVQCDRCTEIDTTKTVSVGDPTAHSFTTKASNTKATDATCTASATYYVQCDNCTAISDTITVSVGDPLEHSYTGESVHTDADGENNGYTKYYCVNGCNELGGLVYDTVDWTAYNDAVTEYNSLKNDETYTADSRAAYIAAVEKAIEGVIVNDKTKSIAFVNAKTTAILYAKDLLKKASTTATITFIKEIAGQEPIETVYNDAKVGDKIELKAAGAYKWVRTDAKGNDTVYARNVDSTILVVRDSITITAHIVEEKEATESSVKVTLLDKQGKAAGVAYASHGVINFAEEVVVDDVALSPVQVPLYSVMGYSINGVAVSGEYSIPSGTTEIVVKPIYTPGTKLRITTNATIKNNGGQSYEAKWDERITLVSDTEVAWVSNGVVLATGKTYSFRANEAIEINAQAITSTITPTARVGYFKYDVELNKVTIVNTFFTNGAAADEAGILLSTKSADKQTIINTGKKFGSTNYTGDKNQVKISVSRTANTAFTMYAVAYVVVDGVTYYANEVATCNYVPQA